MAFSTETASRLISYWARAGEMQQLTPIMIERFLESGKRGKDPEMYEGYVRSRSEILQSRLDFSTS